VGAQLVRMGIDLFYWREGNDEVDYVLKLGRKIVAIEVKSGRERKKSGLVKFKQKFPSAELILITPENYFEFEKDPRQFVIKNESH
jgi:predicted AAA+ superfamily ATPase